MNHPLEHLMQKVGITTEAELSQKAAVSLWQIARLRNGLILQTRVEILLKLSQALEISLTDLLNALAPTSVPPDIGPSEPDLQQEYQYLQQQLEEQRQNLMEEFQRSCLQTLESWLLQWPTVAAKVQENPQVPAQRLLPLVKPIEQLLAQWGVTAIAAVGAEVPYDPQQHQLVEGVAQPGDQVKIRYTGYCQGETLLYRAQVSPIPPPTP